MAKYGFGDLKIEFDNASDSLVDMSAYITTINGFSIEAVMQEITAAGNADEAWAAVGVNKVSPVTLGGFYDDQATTGPDAIFNAIGNTTSRTLKFTWGGTKTSSVENVIKRYDRKPTRGELIAFEVELQPTGAVTEN